jgi:hypothetical protein
LQIIWLSRVVVVELMARAAVVVRAAIEHRLEHQAAHPEQPKAH